MNWQWRLGRGFPKWAYARPRRPPSRRWPAGGHRLMLAVATLLAAVLLDQELLGQELRYDAQVAWIKAGNIDLSLHRWGDRYELSGAVKTSKAMDRFFKWRGRLAATGHLVDDYPHTEAYLLLTDNGKNRKMLLAFNNRTTIHGSDRKSREVKQPPGSDLMSVAFLATHCLIDTVVHDGDEVYQLTLERATDRYLRQRRPYYSGPSRRCDYRVRYEGGKRRYFSLWVSTRTGRPLPVRLRIRIPLLPDGLLRLRLDYGTFQAGGDNLAISASRE